MPNIIEQQDLLKGLPDARLAMLMQNPAGDIPPFLVAAEAQRRQAIRQQFSGAGSNESVVDTLTKQMASVPQNIQAPAQTPPNIPQPMQPQAQMQAPQQGMANGGMVKGYAPGGEVFRGRAGSGGYETPSDPYGIFGDMYDYVAPALSGFTENMQKFGINPTPQQRAELEEESAASVAPNGGGILDIPSPSGGPKTRGYPTNRDPQRPAPKTTQPPNPNRGKDDTSYENKYKAQEAELRDRLEAMYASEEPSSWEDAQKWFAMSQQIMNPEVDLMQGIVNAGAVFADASAQQAQSERELGRSREEALLKWDMNMLDYDRQREQARIDEEKAAAAASLKARTDVATGQLDDLYRQQRDTAERLRSIDASVMKGEMDPAMAETEKANLRRELTAIGSKITAYESFIGDTYGFSMTPVVDLASNTIKPPGT